MTRIQRIVLRHQIAARVRELNEDSGYGPTGEIRHHIPGDWMPWCRVPRTLVFTGSSHATRVAVRH